MTDAEDMTLVEDMLADGVDDWVSAADVYGVAARCGATDPAVLRALAVGLVAEVLVRGYMVAGTIAESGFVPWDAGTAEAICRVATEWFGRDDREVLLPGEIVWLNNTALGEEIGEAALRRQAGDDRADPAP